MISNGGTCTILGIETSCDETSVALIRVENGKRVSILEHIIYSQVKDHQKFGGVVPELAARKHVEILPHIIQKFLKKKDFSFDTLDAIAVTHGPGLVTSLMVGVDIAKTLALVFHKPLIPVNHLKGHILVSELPEKKEGEIHKIFFPALALVVSGGHTELVIMKSHTQFERVGQTIDDAAGEAYDKVAKIMGLSYPGGPLLDALAQKGKKDAYDFPRPMSKHDTLNFSFSGLKTAVKIKIEKEKKFKKEDVAASFQQAVVDSLMIKLTKGIEIYNPRSIVLGGGVANNSLVRKEFIQIGKRFSVHSFATPRKYTMDNSAMIAWAGYYDMKKAQTANTFHTITAQPNLTYEY